MLPIDVWAWDDKYKKNLSQNIVDRYVRRCIACLVAFKVKRYSAAPPLETDNKEVNLSKLQDRAIQRSKLGCTYTRACRKK